MDLMMRRRKLLAPTEPADNRIYLYKDGDQCTSLTGGWYVVSGSVSLRDSYIQFDSMYNNLVRTTAEDIFTEYGSTIGFDVENISSSSGANHSITLIVGEGGSGRQIAVTGTMLPAGQRREFSFKLTAYYGAQKNPIGIRGYFSRWRVYRVWLEKQ